MVLGQEQVPQAELLGLQLELLEHGGVGLPSFLALTELRLEDGVGGDAIFVDELFNLGLLAVAGSQTVVWLETGTRSSVFLARSLTKG